MATGATRAERIADALAVHRADYNKVLVKKRITCPDCAGSSAKIQVQDTDEETDKVSVTPCATCENSGAIEVEEYDADRVPASLRKYVQGFKVGPRGKLIPEMRSKDKAATELIKMISAGWSTTFPRDAYGGDAPGGEPVDPLSKEGIIGAYARIAQDADPSTAMAALREIAKMKGYISPDDGATDNQALGAQDIQGFFNALLQSKGHSLPQQANVEAESADDPGPNDEGIEEG